MTLQIIYDHDIIGQCHARFRFFSWYSLRFYFYPRSEVWFFSRVRVFPSDLHKISSTGITGGERNGEKSPAPSEIRVSRAALVVLAQVCPAALALSFLSLLFSFYSLHAAHRLRSCVAERKPPSAELRVTWSVEVTVSTSSSSWSGTL